MMEDSLKAFKEKRWPTRIVTVGKIGIGGDNPIRIQSMTTTNTRDVAKTVDQVMMLADHGCELVRVTVQGKKEAEACELIKNCLSQRGYETPLVADIHFYPPAAMLVAEYVDKIRVNPGNYVDRRAIFKQRNYTDQEYLQEIEKIEEGFSPLVVKCKERGVAMRIGANHGSLSDRIMNRYGDTPKGMVESAFEFARICRKLDYHNFIFSMKASSPSLMIEAYRLLVKEMALIGWDYPIHLGVTEAGEGEDGRIKSAVGIGTLLLEGIGDTIRVSLTEDPWKEIDPCKRLIKLHESYLEDSDGMALQRSNIFKVTNEHKSGVIQPSFLSKTGVLLKVSKEEMMYEGFYEAIGAAVQLGRPVKTQKSVDAVIVESITEEILPIVNKLIEAQIEVLCSSSLQRGLWIKGGTCNDWASHELKSIDYVIFEIEKGQSHLARAFIQWLKEQKISVSVVLAANYDLPDQDLIIHSACELGSLLVDQLGDGILILSNQSIAFKSQLSFGILQAARRRSSKTEYIACPGCGRTLFDLQSVTLRIKEKTKHLPGVKIAIMGCIVNGPGEMADADFGFVGSKTGKVDLYLGKTCVMKDVDHENADEKLIELIKQEGKWIEAEEAAFVTSSV